MGLCISKKIVDYDNLKSRIDELEQNPERNNLEERLRSLEAKADANNDGVVTREEMENYMATQLKLREDDLIRMNQENEALKEALSKAEQKYETLLEKVNQGLHAEVTQTSRVSNVAIEKQIQTWLDDPSTNFSLIPDRAEMFAYKKMIVSLLGGMEKLFETFALEFMGHRIMVTMQPLKEENIKSVEPH